MATVVLGRFALRRACMLARNAQKTQHAWKNLRTISVSSKLFAQRYFTEKHEWVDEENGNGKVGITDYAQDKLGEVVYVQLPEIGTEVELDGEAGILESVKAASEVYSPVTGEVIEGNNAVVDNPKLINESPFEQGWLFTVKLSQPEELEALMTESAYKKYCETLE
ncbi:glycine cleavage system H protein-like [Mytilus trossulus]|uniref:glycine cleavage system H protein-like n=1 Tax=Mytilus trossulus TaxID=6551 RepID=UPI003003A845